MDGCTDGYTYHPHKRMPATTVNHCATASQRFLVPPYPAEDLNPSSPIIDDGIDEDEDE